MLFLVLSLVQLLSGFSSKAELVDWNTPPFSHAISVFPEHSRDSLKQARIKFFSQGDSGKEFNPEQFCSGDRWVAAQLAFDFNGKPTLSVREDLVRYFQNTQDLTFSDQMSCKFKSAKKQILASIVHELAHLYDKTFAAHHDPSYRYLVDNNFGQRVRNRNLASSPDEYEFFDSAESFAVNSEYFFLAPEYACRRPAFAKVLSRIYNVEPSPCENPGWVIVRSQVVDTGSSRRPVYLEDRFETLDPNRIYAIHYLLGASGGGAINSFGHAMFRLVVCAPNRPKGPECLKDLAHHRVAGYWAPVTNPAGVVIDGLAGKLKIQLLIKPFFDVLEELTHFEFRDLKAVDLRLSPDRIKDFVDVLVDRHWGYASKYLFLTNNCGTEAKKHLRLAGDPGSGSLTSFSPKSMFNQVSRSLYNQSADVRPQIFVYKSKLEVYLNALRSITGSTKLKKRDLENFSAMPVAARFETYLRYLKKNSDGITAQNLKKRRNEIDFFERWVQRKLGSEFISSLTKFALRKSKDLHRIKDSILGVSLSPAELFRVLFQEDQLGYGVPVLSSGVKGVLSERSRAWFDKHSDFFESYIETLGFDSELGRRLLDRYQELRSAQLEIQKLFREVDELIINSVKTPS